MEMQENRTDLYQIVLPEQQYFTYKIKPFELTNFLGVQLAVLHEYSIQNKSGEIYKLYKTTEGNWYDIAEEVTVERSAVLRLLKAAIESKENQ